MTKLASLFPSTSTKRNDSNTHNALFSQKALFILFETGRISGYCQYCKLVPQHSQLLHYRPHRSIGFRPVIEKLIRENWTNRPMYNSDPSGSQCLNIHDF